MDYKSIRQTVHMSRSTETPETVAEREYRQRLNGWSTFRSGITLRGSELFVVNFRELATITDSIRDQENKVAELWNAQTADIESPDFVNDTIRLLDRFNVIRRPDFQEKLI